MCDDTKIPGTNCKSPDAPLDLTPEEFRHHIEALDYTREQQDELLDVLWNIMGTFVNMGWGLDAIQPFLQDLFDTQAAEKLAPDSGKLLESMNTTDGIESNRKEEGSNHD